MEQAEATMKLFFRNLRSENRSKSDLLAIFNRSKYEESGRKNSKWFIVNFIWLQPFDFSRERKHVNI